MGRLLDGDGRLARVNRALQGPRLQFLNLLVLFTVVNLTIDYPNPWWGVALAVALAAAIDAPLSRWRWGEWRIPWPSMVAALGISLVVDAHGVLPWLALPVLMVGSKHLIRWRGQHLFNPNNFAASLLLLAGVVRVGVNDWGAAPQALALVLLFGTIATSRVKRFDLAVAYLALSVLAYAAVAAFTGWGWATVWMFALSPLQVVLGFFAITDPATSPHGRTEKLLFAALLVALAVPATLSGRADAPIFALLLAAPQRHVITWLVRGRLPAKPMARAASLAHAGTAAGGGRG